MTADKPCSCDWETGECQGPIGCKAAKEFTLLKERIGALQRLLGEIESLSDNCINEECYGGEEALTDLMAIRHAIKRGPK